MTMLAGERPMVDAVDRKKVRTVNRPCVAPDFVSYIGVSIKQALHNRGCSCGLNPPVSSRDLAM